MQGMRGPMIELSSGKPLHKLTLGQSALASVLVNCPPHRFDRDNQTHVVECLRSVDLAPSAAVEVWAEILREATAAGHLRECPRVHLITQWVSAAMQMEREIAELY